MSDTDSSEVPKMNYVQGATGKGLDNVSDFDEESKTGTRRSVSLSPTRRSRSRTKKNNVNRSKKKKHRKRLRSLSSSSSDSLIRSHSPPRLYKLKHRVDGNLITFLSDRPFTNNKPTKRQCQYLLEGCTKRILTKRDKKNRNVKVIMKKRN